MVMSECNYQDCPKWMRLKEFPNNKQKICLTHGEFWVVTDEVKS